jgi:hypothetical protein
VGTHINDEYKNRKMLSLRQAWQYMPTISAIQEIEAGKSRL